MYYIKVEVKASLRDRSTILHKQLGDLSSLVLVVLLGLVLVVLVVLLLVVLAGLVLGLLVSGNNLQTLGGRGGKSNGGNGQSGEQVGELHL